MLTRSAKACAIQLLLKFLDKFPWCVATGGNIREGRNASVFAVSSAKRGGGRVQDAAMLKLQFAKSLLRQRPSGLAQSDVGRREPSVLASKR